MYKVIVSEKEAWTIGERRWMAQNNRRYSALIFLPLVALVFLLILFRVFNISNWVNMPFSVVLIGLSTYFLWRGSKLCTKAGKEFIQSLEKEE